MGDVSDRIGRPTDNGQVHPSFSVRTPIFGLLE
jgi:hypothetical protein